MSDTDKTFLLLLLSGAPGPVTPDQKKKHRQQKQEQQQAAQDKKPAPRTPTKAEATPQSKRHSHSDAIRAAFNCMRCLDSKQVLVNVRRTGEYKLQTQEAVPGDKTSKKNAKESRYDQYGGDMIPCPDCCVGGGGKK